MATADSPTSPQKIPVILNCRAGTQAGEDMTQSVKAQFRDAGLEAEILVAGEGDLSRIAKQALERRPALIVAGGGDGTINAVASAVIGTDTVLGVLPLGTLNHFARDLRIPADLEGAVRVIANGRDTRIDAGEVNGRVFINNSSLGLYPSLVYHREQQQMRLGRSKWNALFWASLLMLRRYPVLRVRVKVNGNDLVCKTPLVFVGNNEYKMEGLDIGMRERIDSGMLSLYIPRREGRLGLLRIVLRALFRRLSRADDFIGLRATEFSVETTRRRVRVATDGEVAVTQAPLNYRIRPGALNVRVPKEVA